MPKSVFSVVFGAAFVFALAASSARADVVHANDFIGQLNGAQHRNLDLPDISRADEQGYFTIVLHSNNGKHFGFTAASVHRGPQIGLVNPGPRASVTQNPEPATILLMGTGLVAVGALIRRRRKV